MGRADNETADVHRPLAEDVLDHRQARAIFDHLHGLTSAPRTIVTEERYVDSDYLADYGAFYGTVFTGFDRFCKRVHFFSTAFEGDEFSRYILSRGDKREILVRNLTKAYLGFTVVRPLPQAFVGRTVVVQPDATEGALRKFPAVVDTTVNLFGLPLSVPRSLPFQQQDNVVAACATVALWSAFHKTADLFGTLRPRPAEITRTATENILNETRSFPARTLTLDQICDAIRANGLDFEVSYVARRSAPILSLVRAYMKMGLPVILGLERASGDYHAVTAVGYEVSPREAECVSIEDPETAPSVGRRLLALFCHDDNVAPFTRYEVCTSPLGSPEPAADKATPVRLRVDEYDEEEPMTLHSVIVPVHPTIRLDFADVQKWVDLLDRTMQATLEFDSPSSDALKATFALREWDVSLVRNDEARDQILKLDLSDRSLLALLTKGQPRYLWQAFMRIDDREMVRFYVDATSFSRAVPLWRFIFANGHSRKSAIQALPGLCEVTEGPEPGNVEVRESKDGERKIDPASADRARALLRFLVAELGEGLGEPD